MARHTISAYEGWAERYGSMVWLPTLAGPSVLLSDPELIRELLSEPDPDYFDIGVPQSFDVVTGPRSMLLLAGEPHRRRRKLLAPSFKGERMRGWAAQIAASTQRAFGSIRGEFRAFECTQRLTLDVIVRVVLGVEQAYAERFIEALVELTSTGHPLFYFFRAAQHDLLGLSPYKRFRLASERFDELLLAHIERVREQLRERPGSRDDLLALMLEARDEAGEGMTILELRDELYTLLIAGHETTASAIAWALYFIHRHPEELERLREELAALAPEELGGPKRTPYLDAVLSESMRLRPPIEHCFRKLRKPMSLGGFEFPAGVTFILALVIVHRDPALWTEPDRFRPERFLERRPSSHVFFPFGGGTRRCIGASFARFEATVALATVLREHAFELLDQEVGYGREGMTFGPLGGVRMRDVGSH